jgi:hypothetical protein
MPDIQVFVQVLSFWVVALFGIIVVMGGRGSIPVKPKKNLWLDDERPAPDASWEVVKTAPEAIVALQQRPYEVISLDHDLGPPSAGTGYDVLLYLERRAFNDLSIPETVLLHTANPVGRAKMRAALTSIRKLQESRQTSATKSFHVQRHS